jgi:hypothetical protein
VRHKNLPGAGFLEESVKYAVGSGLVLDGADPRSPHTCSRTSSSTYGSHFEFLKETWEESIRIASCTMSSPVDDPAVAIP